MKSHPQAFTLIELLVTVAIVGILAAIALPSYRAYVVKSLRAEAKGNVLNIAQMQERYFTNNGSYLAIAAPPANAPSGWQNYSGNNLASRKYDIAVTPGPTNSLGTSFLITATPSNGFSDTQCGALTLDSTGAKGSAIGNASPCW